MYRFVLAFVLVLSACADPAAPSAPAATGSVEVDGAPVDPVPSEPEEVTEPEKPAVGEEPASGAEAGVSSVYTDLDLDACEVLQVFEEGGGVELRCDGHDGVDLFVSEGDLRFDVDVGVPNDTWTSATPFNTLGDTVEWRLVDGAPVAVILRYNLDNGDGFTRSDLAVISVGTAGAPGCLVGWVGPNESPSQNVAARQLADAEAAAVDCTQI